MQIKKITFILIFILITGIFVGQALGESLLPGSKEDPLVTQSYVDQYIADAFENLFAQTTEIAEKLPEINDAITNMKKIIKPVKIKLTLGKKEAYLGDELYFLDAAPFTENDRTLVPFRFVGEALGAEIGWNGATQTVSYTLHGTTVELSIGSKKIIVNGSPAEMDVPAQLKNERTLVPVRVVTEQLGFNVEWLPETKEIVISP